MNPVAKTLVVSHMSSMITCSMLVSVWILTTYPLIGQTKGSFADPRDGKQYATVTYSITASTLAISDLDEYATYVRGASTYYEATLNDLPATITWMTSDLNYEMEASKCKDESEKNCESGNRTYTWEAARQACPEGWHLPSDDEWFLLASFYGGVASAGEHLKSTSYGGINTSLFNVDRSSIFWSSNELDDSEAWDWKLNYRWKKLQRWKGGKHFYNSVRCVQDY